jgi:DNA-binding Lrp family transcriptional regulator
MLSKKGAIEKLRESSHRGLVMSIVEISCSQRLYSCCESPNRAKLNNFSVLSCYRSTTRFVHKRKTWPFMSTKRPPTLDRIDIKILSVLQRDGRSTIQKLAEIVGLSARPCLERVRRLEAAGIISGYRAVVAIEKLSRPVTVFAEIALETQAHRERLVAQLTGIEEIAECWEVSGTYDYLARFVCADLALYEALTAALIDDPKLGVSRIISHIALRPIRQFEGYPASLLVPRSS